MVGEEEGEERTNLFDVRPVRVEGGEELEHVIAKSCDSDGSDSWLHLRRDA